jgi:glycosyltransferase involved in cell wall biosynthesis
MVGVVVIGRNEGERLRLCLESVLPAASLVVYVDSGSTDGSVATALGLGVKVIHLDLSLPFTAARARNLGWRMLRDLAPEATYVQFVDGDCEVVSDWIERAQAFLDATPQAVAVCGRRRERFPGRSVYNMLCDLEWDTPIGLARYCGGDVMMRLDALANVGGYRDDLIAGEEPELCVRLRAKGWQIWRIDAEMTLHDAAMTRFGQWWMRSLRGGHAFAEGASLHGAAPERHWVRESRSALFWGLGLPLTLLLLGTQWPEMLWGFLVYPLQVVRLLLKGKGELKQRWARAVFLVLGKFAEAVGHLKFYLRRLTGGASRLIEYK